LLIHKTAVNMEGPTLLPYSASIIKFGVQHDTFYVWYIHNGDDLVEYELFIVPTGKAFEGLYVDTCFDGPYVWHLIEK